MPDDEEVQSATSVEGQGQESTTTTETPPEGGNPAWADIRGKLDPVSFKLIEDDLKGFDRSAQQRIESVNSQYKWAKELADQGVTPEVVAQSVGLYQRVQTEPEVIFGVLRDFLKENGRLPTEAEAQQAVDEVEGEEGEKPQQINDPRLDRMAQFLDQQEQQQQAFAMQQLQAQADTQIETEIKQLRETHPGYTEKDIQVIARLAAAESWNRSAQGNRTPYSMIEADALYQDMRQSILEAPRAGDSAPKLTSPSGGTPAVGSDQKKPGELSRQETQDLVANYLTKVNQQSS